MWGLMLSLVQPWSVALASEGEAPPCQPCHHLIRDTKKKGSHSEDTQVSWPTLLSQLELCHPKL